MERHPTDAGRAPAASDPPPAYDLADRLVVTRAEQVRALGHPLRTTVLGLLTERAASVAELAQATGRAKGTVAHHVGVLHRAGLVQVVGAPRGGAGGGRGGGRAAPPGASAGGGPAGFCPGRGWCRWCAPAGCARWRSGSTAGPPAR